MTRLSVGGLEAEVVARVFISHSSKDAAFAVGRLKPLLEQTGASVWCSSANLASGVDWEKQILAELSRADWVLVVLSPDAAQSDWVRAEVHWALEKRKGRVVPIMMRSCDPAAVHLRLGTIQFIDFRVDAETAAASLLARVRGEEAAPCASCRSETTVVMLRDGAQERRLRARFLLVLGEQTPCEVSAEIDHECVVGRALDVDLPIVHSSVSRHHARLNVVQKAGRKHLEITDLKSSNGTYLNEQRLRATQCLAVGDVVDLGVARLTLLGLD